MAGDGQSDYSLVAYAISRATKLGASYADATQGWYGGQGYLLKQGSLEGAWQGEVTGLRVRILKDGYLHSLSTERPTKESVSRLFDNLCRFRKPGVVGLAESKAAPKASYKVREKMQPDQKELLRMLVDEDREIGRVKCIRFRYGQVSYDHSIKHFESTDGARIDSDTARTGAFFSIVAASGAETRQRMLSFGVSGGIENVEGFRIAEHAVEDARNMKKVMESGVNVSGPIKRIVISPEITGIAVHESIGHPFEADRLIGREAAQAGMSYLNTSNLGMRIGSEAVTICDDPTLKGANCFYLYDDEGTPAQKRVLVKGGMQVGLLHNRETGMIFNTRSNGSARSSQLGVEPLVRMANTYLEPDRSNKFGDLVEEAGDGIYVKNFTEWNIDDTRSFSKYQGNEAYLIKNGRIGKPVKNFSLESKTVDFWNSVRMVDNEFELGVGNCGKGEPEQGVPVAMGGPAALLVFG